MPVWQWNQSPLLMNPTNLEDPPANNLQGEEDDNGGVVDGNIDSKVILVQTPSESPGYLPSLCGFWSLCYCTVWNLPLTVEGLGIHLNISYLPNLICWFLHEQLVQVDADIELNDVPLSDCPVLTNMTKIHVLPLPFTMPQMTCLAQEGCFMNVFESLTPGDMVLWGTIVFLFSMIPMNQVSVGCTWCRYAIYFLFVIIKLTFLVHWSPGIWPLVPHHALRLECGRSSPILII